MASFDVGEAAKSQSAVFSEDVLKAAAQSSAPPSAEGGLYGAKAALAGLTIDGDTFAESGGGSGDLRPLAGSTTTRVAEPTAERKQCWMPGAGERFSLRIGPNYKRSGKKAPSVGQLYDCVAMDCVSNTHASNLPVEHYAERVQLPGASVCNVLALLLLRGAPLPPTPPCAHRPARAAPARLLSSP